MAAEISKIAIKSTNYGLKDETARNKRAVNFVIGTDTTTTNLNELTSPGFYSAGGSNSCTNKPSGVDAFGMIVTHDAGGNYYTQVLNAITGKSYRRVCTNGTWGSWTEINKTSLPANGGTADKIGTATVGSTTQPVYINAGKPTVCTYTLGKSVPSDAKFTDTVTTVDSALSTTSTNPVQNKVINTALSNKVDKVSGKVLSDNNFTSEEKTKLAGIATGATANAGTITGIKMNGKSVATSGVADLGTVLTSGKQTTTSTADSGNNVYTFSDGSTIIVRNGSKGSTGTNGSNGTSASWFTGTAVTGTSTTATTFTVSGSKAGDMYLNTGTYNVYRASAANSWVYVCNIKGAQGAKGNNGTNGTTPTIQASNGANVASVGTPSVTASTSGTTTTFTFNYLKGATGASGTSAKWFTGTAVTGTSTSISATVSGSKAGDMYLNTSTAYVYSATAANTWKYVCSIKGATGGAGTTPTIKAASGTNIGVVGTPTVTATTSGTTTTFTFNNLKGAKGDPGQNATTTSIATADAHGLMSKWDKANLDKMYIDGKYTTIKYDQSKPTPDDDRLGKLRFASFMSNESVNGDSSFKNWYYSDAYAGTDVGGATAIGVSRTNGKVFAMWSDSDRASWSGKSELLTTDSLPTASSTTLGGVKIGTNISISSGTIFVPTASSTQAGVMSIADKKALDELKDTVGTRNDIFIMTASQYSAATKQNGTLYFLI